MPASGARCHSVSSRPAHTAHRRQPALTRGSRIVKGLFYGGGTAQLIAQAIGSGAICLATLGVSFALMYAVKATGTLRISREGEIEGMDLHEHGMLAYPEYVIHGYDPTPHFSSSAKQSGMAMAAAPDAVR